MKKIILAGVLAAGFAAGAYAQQPAAQPVFADPAGFSDPAFQDFVETSYGYMRPGSQLASTAAYRDAVASPAAVKAPLAVGRYVFVTILPRSGDYSALLRELSSSGFVLKGERTRTAGGVRQTRLVGWARAGAVSAIRANPAVAGVSVKRNRSAAF